MKVPILYKLVCAAVDRTISMQSIMNDEKLIKESQMVESDADLGVYEAHIASISILLGVVGGSSLTLAATNYVVFPQFWLFIALLCVFHYLEFVITSLYNHEKLSVDSFLLNNGRQYTYAQAVAVIEALIRYYIFASTPRISVSILGFATLLVSQFIRSFAMVSAGRSFSHAVARRKLESHVLVTTGIYRYSRHPSYCGYFFWALGSQLLLGNYLTLAAFTIVLWRFFNSRIHTEEQYLVAFFGKQYLEYRRKVGTLIPGIP